MPGDERHWLIPHSAANLCVAQGHRSTSTPKGPHLLPIIQHLGWSRTFSKYNHKPLQHKLEKMISNHPKRVNLYLHLLHGNNYKKTDDQESVTWAPLCSNNPLFLAFSWEEILSCWGYDGKKKKKSCWNCDFVMAGRIQKRARCRRGPYKDQSPVRKACLSGWEGHLNGVWRGSRQIKVWEQKHWP